MPKKSKSSTLGYTEDHAASGLDAALPLIECWPNQFAGYEIEISRPEFTSVCPKIWLPGPGPISPSHIPD